jgi:hypothetical protein
VRTIIFLVRITHLFNGLRERHASILEHDVDQAFFHELTCDLGDWPAVFLRLPVLVVHVLVTDHKVDGT